MSIRYKIVQNKIENSLGFNRWYARAVVLNTVGTEDLAEEVSHATTLTFADVMGVLIELSNVISRHLLNSDKVQLYRLGSFRAGLRCKSVEKEEDLDANAIRGFRIIYSPNVKFVADGGVSAKGHRTGSYAKPLLQGAKAELLDTTKKAKPASTTTAGS